MDREKYKTLFPIVVIAIPLIIGVAYLISPAGSKYSMFNRVFGITTFTLVLIPAFYASRKILKT